MNRMHDYKTGEFLRFASDDELTQSVEAAMTDGGSGVFRDGESQRPVYVVEAPLYLDQPWMDPLKLLALS